MFPFPNPANLPEQFRAEAAAILADFKREADEATESTNEVLDTIRSHHGTATADVARQLLRMFDVSINLLTGLATAGVPKDALMAMFRITERTHTDLMTSALACALCVDDPGDTKLGTKEACDAATDALMKLMAGLMKREMSRVTGNASRGDEFRRRVEAFRNSN